MSVNFPPNCSNYEAARQFIDEKSRENEQTLGKAKKTIEQHYQREMQDVEAARSRQQDLQAYENERLERAVEAHQSFLSDQSHDFNEKMKVLQQESERKQKEHEQEMLIRRKKFEEEYAQQLKEIEAREASLRKPLEIMTNPDQESFGSGFGANYPSSGEIGSTKGGAKPFESAAEPDQESFGSGFGANFGKKIKPGGLGLEHSKKSSSSGDEEKCLIS